MALQDLNTDTVYDRRKNWLSQGFAFLYDMHRSGAPPKMNAIHYDQIKTWAEKEALTGSDSGPVKRRVFALCRRETAVHC